MKKKISFSILILVIAFSIGLALKTKAGPSDSGSGWLWGGSEETDDGMIDGDETGVGWISMNSTNCDADENGFIDISYCDLNNNGYVDPSCGGNDTTDISASCGGNNTTTAVINYGVSIPDGDGNVTGYAWSENLGYINFNPAGDFATYPGCGFPSSPCNSVQRNVNDLEGWARFEEIRIAGANSGGWEGWIKMKGATYGVSIIPATGALTGFASAGEDELGWIDFSRASIVTPKTLKICEGGCDGGIALPNSFTMLESSFKNLYACYNDAIGCTDAAGDVTAISDWAETSDPDNAIELNDTNSSPETLNANAVDGNKSAFFKVDYSAVGATLDFNVTVLDTCQCKACDSSDNCVDTTYTGASCPCIDSCTVVPNSCIPPSVNVGDNWREVAP